MWLRFPYDGGTARQSHSGNDFMLQLQMFQESYFDFLAYELIHMIGLKGDSEVSKRLLWQQNLGVIVVFKNILRTIAIEVGHQIHHVFESGKLGVDLDAIDVTRGLVVLWHNSFGFAMPMQRPRPLLGLFHPIRSRGIY